MPIVSVHQSAMAEVGRVGRLDLHYQRQGPRTILAGSRCSTPWHLFPPMYLDTSGCAFTSLVNPSGGYVAGDRLSMHASLDCGAHVVLSTPSATRVYRSLGEEARQTVTLSVASGAILEWFPDVTIPFAGSRFLQTMEVQLAKGATALIWDSFASGRVARHERWAFTSLRNEIHMTTASGAQLVDRYAVRPERGQAGLVSAYDYVASFLVVSDGIGSGRWPALRELMGGIIDSMGDELLGGVTEPPVPGVAVKLVARSAHSLVAAQEALWQAARMWLFDLERPDLRRN